MAIWQMMRWAEIKGIAATLIVLDLLTLIYPPT
jgi:hypothetical protein